VLAPESEEEVQQRRILQRVEDWLQQNAGRESSSVPSAPSGPDVGPNLPE